MVKSCIVIAIIAFINKVECSKASENFLDTNVEDFLGAFCPFSATAISS